MSQAMPSTAGVLRTPEPTPKRRLTRAEKARETRANLLAAAIEAVGDHGFAGATVARIAEGAGVAHGTFYTYFESRQALLDQLLPDISVELLNHIREKVLEAPDDPIARERARIEGFFEFLRDTPHLFTMLHEGEFHTREGFHRHVEMQTESYLRAMQYEARQGNLRVEDPRELQVVCRMLMASRDYISNHYCMRDGKVVSPPPHVVDSYMNFAVAGLFKTPGERT
jgi:AcrR family transcriptional regulator